MKDKSPLLEMTGVSKVFQREILNIESLALQEGLIYGVIGPSGAGKSTLLRIINLLTPPTQGTYHFMGEVVQRESDRERLKFQREMALVFQKTLLFRESVWHNIAFGLKARKIPRRDVEKRVDELLAYLGMEDLAHRRGDTLSGGEAQRVAIARAVAFEPKLLLLDEPTANLDPRNVALIEDMIQGMSRDKGITVVMVTHNVFQARRVSDQVIFIDEGRIVEIGPVDRVFSPEAHRKTRAYVQGKMIY
ncbi:MAG: hypothetical protein AVO33_09160 [delta proteobacterium ML8_F1]|nr:MAG: hypothetical protein AVO33_09160 [delta proteobacterium ML8_F1]